MATSPNPYSRPQQQIIEASYTTQLAAQQNQRAKELAAKEKQKLDQQLKDAIKQVNDLVVRKRNTDASLTVEKNTLLALKAAATSSTGPGGVTITPTELAAIQAQEAVVAAKQNQLDQITTNLKGAWETEKSIAQQLTSTSTSSAKTALEKAKKNKTTTKSKSPYVNESPGGKGNSNPIGNAGQVSDQYYYNAPMVRTAYINPRGPQTQSTDLSMSGSNNPQRASTAWQNLFASKGMIQMNRENAAVFANSMAANNASYDDSLYGFKFLYNPKEVSMTWGLAEGSNWEGIAAGLDPTSPITPGLMYSTISFSLLLNRTNDMAWLDSNGLIAGVENPYPTFATKPGRTVNQELSEIYKRGTMYDLEYLFKTIMGLNATYKSVLNGETADKGWLQGVAVELHLGAGMRYLVRIGSLDINHAMFNERMVPILSTINITCSRFNDVVQTR